MTWVTWRHGITNEMKTLKWMKWNHLITLGKLQTARYMESEDLRTHLSNLNMLYECLSKIGSPISDVQFNAYIHTSLSLSTRYQPLLTILSTTAWQTKSILSSDNLIWHLVEEANTIKLEVSINKTHVALNTARGWSNKSSSDKGEGQDGRWRHSSRSKLQCTNSNCKSQKGHTFEECFMKGGGKEHDILDWYKKRQEAKTELKKESANSTAEGSSTCEKHAYATIGPTHLIPVPIVDGIPTTLVITSGHDHEAFGVSPSIAATFSLINWSLSISRLFSPSLFMLLMDIPFRQLALGILSLPSLLMTMRQDPLSLWRGSTIHLRWHSPLFLLPALTRPVVPSLFRMGNVLLFTVPDPTTPC